MRKQMPASYFKNQVTQEVIDTQWPTILEGMALAKKRRSRLVLLSSSGGLIVAAFIVAAIWSQFRAPFDYAQTTFETTATPKTIQLADGSTADLEPRTRLEARLVSQNEMTVQLHHGRADFDVKPKPGRRFSVNVSGIEIVVKGTRFTVQRTGDITGSRVEVQVREGHVAVITENGSTLTLDAGQSWSIKMGTQELKSAEVEAATFKDDSNGRQNREKAAPVSERANPKPDTQRGSTNVDGSIGLWKAAKSARLKGDHRAEARLYQELLDRYPKSSRAGLAAFGLGRLRMDVFGDLSGAIAALQIAIKLSPNATFHDDALARLTRAYHQSGDHHRCKKTKKTYLTRYPNGVHAQRISRLCAQ